MKRVFHKSKNFAEAEKWDILQHINLTPEERQQIAVKLRKRVYGENLTDVREAHQNK